MKIIYIPTSVANSEAFESINTSEIVIESDMSGATCAVTPEDYDNITAKFQDVCESEAPDNIAEKLSIIDNYEDAKRVIFQYLNEEL